MKLINEHCNLESVRIWEDNSDLIALFTIKNNNTDFGNAWLPTNDQIHILIVFTLFYELCVLKLANRPLCFRTWSSNPTRTSLLMSSQRSQTVQCIKQIVQRLYSTGRLPADVKSKVLSLHEVATHLRKRREANGSLRLDQPKLKFALDDDTKLPFGVTIYEVV